MACSGCQKTKLQAIDALLSEVPAIEPYRKGQVRGPMGARDFAAMGLVGAENYAGYFRIRESAPDFSQSVVWSDLDTSKRLAAKVSLSRSPAFLERWNGNAWVRVSEYVYGIEQGLPRY